MIVVAYYTVGTQINYKAMVPRFTQSLKKFRLKYDIEEIRDKGSWRKNLGYRPEFFLKMLDKHQQSILSIDVDATVCQSPYLLLSNPPCDVAFHCLANCKPCGGTLYFANTKMARKVLRDWKQKEIKMPNSRSDEFALRAVFCEKGCVGIQVVRLYLPQSYLRVPQYRKAGVKAVIDHDMVSCTSKHKPKKPPMPKDFYRKCLLVNERKRNSAIYCACEIWTGNMAIKMKDIVK